MTLNPEPTAPSAEQRAALALRRMRAKLEILEQEKNEPIAIIGLGCRFPGDNQTPDAFWQFLRSGQDAIRSCGAERWNLDAFYEQYPDLPGRISTQWGGFLESVDQFDAAFFGISPREAIYMDPQQRLLLEVSWEALEHAGQSVHRLAGSQTGVFVGMANRDYNPMSTFSPVSIDPYVATGSSYSIAAGRLSYTFDFRGPSIAIDTACSSSLVATHLACQSLRAKECQLALVGGVNLVLSPLPTLAFAKWGMLSPDSCCRTFDAQANGFVRGEGCGAIVLKRYADALKDGDRILALIRGSAVNQDGRSNGLTAPNVLAQQAVIRQALQNAGVSPAEIAYVEAHGTGTPIGDPIELEALKATIAQPRTNQLPCLIGSVKTNLGHLEAAAGMAGLIKVVLSLQNGEIPPNLHFEQLNPNISLDHTPLAIPTSVHAWPKGENPRYAGISSFGYSGTNAHLILSDTPAAPAAPASPERDYYLLPLSAHTPDALYDLARAYQSYLSDTSQPLNSICYTASLRRSHHEYRLAVCGSNQLELNDELQTLLKNAADSKTMHAVQPSSSRKIAFIFPGQGSQWPEMGRDLYRTEPVFRAMIDECAFLMRPYLDRPLIDDLFAVREQSRWRLTSVAQPTLFAIEVALAALWQARGIVPQAVIGHSVGEIAAAYVAGALSLADAARLVCLRGQVMHPTSGQGKMVAVGLSPEQAQEIIDNNREAGRVSISAINGPQSVILAGTPDAIDQLTQQFSPMGIFQRVLDMPYAFHSPQMDPCQVAFIAQMQPGALCSTLEPSNSATQQPTVQPQPTRLLMISTVTGAAVSGPELTIDYWAQNLRDPVRFADAVDKLVQDDYDVFIEIGPHPVLSTPITQILAQAGRQGLALPSLRRGQDGQRNMLQAFGQLYKEGVAIDWQKLYPTPESCAVLPSYPWQHESFWLEDHSPYTIISEAQPEATAVPSQHKIAQAASLHSQEQRWDETWLQVPVWETLHPLSFTPHHSPEHWLVLVDQQGIAERLCERLRQDGHTCAEVRPGPEYVKLDALHYQIRSNCASDFHQLVQDMERDTPTTGILHLWNLDLPAIPQVEDLEPAVALGSSSLVHLVQALNDLHSQTPPPLWLITSGAQPAGETDPVNVTQAPAWGLGRVIAAEYPALVCRCVDLSPMPELEIEQLWAEIQATPPEKQVALRSGRRLGFRLKPYKKQNSAAPCICPDGTYLITGGLGGLGLTVAQWLVEQGGRHLILIGRRVADKNTQSIVNALGAQGATVLTANIDITDRDALAAILKMIDVEMPPLRGVIHAAGILDDTLIQGLDHERLWRVMAPKVLGAWHLHMLTVHQPLDFFILFSSAASFGSPGQGNYVAANVFLDSLAHARKQMKCPALSINWGPWSQVGMAARTHAAERLAQQGVASLPPQEGLIALAQVLNEPVAQIGIFSPRLYTAETVERKGNVETPMIKTEKAKERSVPVPAATLLEQLTMTAPDQHYKIMEDYVCELTARILRLPRSILDNSTVLGNLGFDSLMALELRSRLEGQLNFKLPPTLIWEYPTLGSLVDHLISRLALGQAATPEARI